MSPVVPASHQELQEKKKILFFFVETVQVSVGWAETICPSLAGPFKSLFSRGRAADAGPASLAGCSQSCAEPFQTTKALRLPDFPLPYLLP